MKISLQKVAIALGGFALLSAPASQVSAATNIGVGAYLSTRMNSSQMTTAATQLGTLGVGWTRQEFNYDNIGGANGSNFGADEEAADKVIAKGVKVLGLLNYSGTTPSSADWQSFVTNTVGHFASRVDAWEVMNEPDGSLASHQIGAATYNDYLFHSYTIIRQLDPSAVVVSAGLASADTSYLNSLIDFGGCSYLDAVAIHPYREDLAPETQKFGAGDFVNDIGRVVSVIRSRCSTKKIWLTEFGYRTDQMSADQQANYLTRSFIAAQAWPEVQAVISYAYEDVSSEGWGLADTNLQTKTSYDRVKDMISAIGGKSFSSELTATDRRIIDGFDNQNGWGQQFNINASGTLSGTTGTSGSGMNIHYQFNNPSQAAVILTKDIALADQPSAIGVDVKGDDSSAIYRLRFTDATGQTFQALLGNGVSSWRYLQFDFSNTAAMTHWNGANDGTIHYPVHFNSLVIDRDGGASSGDISVDSLVAVYGAADYRALKFGDTVAAWKGLGSGTTTINGQTKTLSETPIYYTDGSSDSSTPALTYHASFVSQSAYPTVNAGSSAAFQVILKNTGTATWTQDVVRLGTDRNQDRIPNFLREDQVGHNPSGWAAGNRVAMQETSVAPGANGTFTFYYTVPANKEAGSYREYFRPVADGLTWMEDMGIYWDITVPQAYDAQFVSQSSYPAISRGLSTIMEVQLKNVGTATWTQDVVHLGTDRSRDRIPSFIREDQVDHNPSGWVTANRIQMLESSVAPGQTATFRFFYTVPADKAPGTYREYFRPVADGITWMNDFGMFWDITVS